MRLNDLIVNIDFEESKKNNGLIIEFYSGTIPHLKSKKFSGQLRNINLNSVFVTNNINAGDLEQMKLVFNNEDNIQVKKNQYLVSLEIIPYLQKLIKNGCLFYRDRTTSMYQVEDIVINSKNEKLKRKVISNFEYAFDKTIVYFFYQSDRVIQYKQACKAKLYIDIHEKQYNAYLLFDYNNHVVRYGNQPEKIEAKAFYRDYAFESHILELMNECGWKYAKDQYFHYLGKDITESIKMMSEAGLLLYTKEEKHIASATLKECSMSYDIDWFELRGTFLANGTEYDLSQIINSSSNWKEINNTIVFIPRSIQKLNEKIEKKNEHLVIDKRQVLNALSIASDLNIHHIKNMNSFISYDQVVLHIPEQLRSMLRGYQVIGVKWLLSLKANGFGGCLADDMGLGKTVEMIAFLSDQTMAKQKTIIIVPKTLLENWKREILKFAQNLSVSIYHGNNRHDIKVSDADLMITTYGTLVNDFSKIKAYKFDNAIVDEAQFIKNSKTRAYKAISSLEASNKYLLTGTPLENNVQEYWNLMRIAVPTNMTFSEVTNGIEAENIINKLKSITQPFLLRRLKSDVLKELPDRTEQTLYCQFSNLERELYDSVLSSVRKEILRKPDRYEVKSNATYLKGLLLLQEICCHPKLIPNELNFNNCYESSKLSLLLTMVGELQAGGHKIVIFSRFSRMLHIIEENLISNHFNTFYIDGSTNNRQKIVDDFEKSKDGIFLISLKAGGVGLNIVSADIVIMYDPWWNPAAEKQAEDRVYRIGQNKKVTIYKLVVANSIEEKVLSLQVKKKDVFDQLMANQNVPSKLSLKIFKELLDIE